MDLEDQASLHGASIGTVVRSVDIDTNQLELVSMSALHLTRVLHFRGVQPRKSDGGQRAQGSRRDSQLLRIHVI